MLEGGDVSCRYVEREEDDDELGWVDALFRKDDQMIRWARRD